MTSFFCSKPSVVSKALGVNPKPLAPPQNAACDLVLHHLSDFSFSSFSPHPLSPVTLMSLVCLKPTGTRPPEDLCTCRSLCLEYFSPASLPHFLEAFTHRPLFREAIPASPPKSHLTPVPLPHFSLLLNRSQPPSMDFIPLLDYKPHEGRDVCLFFPLLSSSVQHTAGAQ